MFGSTIRTLCVLAFAVHTALAGVATIYLVDPPAPTETDTEVSVLSVLGTTHVSAVGTGENGRTKYEMDAVQSLLVASIRGSTHTVLSEPYTNKYYFEENQSEMKLYQIRTKDGQNADPPVTAFEQDCKLDIANQSGECVQRYIYRMEYLTDSAGTTTRTRTYETTSAFTGALFPVATVTTSEAKQVINRDIVLLATVGLVTIFSRFL